MSNRRRWIAAVAGFAFLGCAPAQPTPTPRPNMDPVREPPRQVEVPRALPPLPTATLPASEAFRRGLMPLASTNVWSYRQAHPTFDGRGVVIGILDSGIDAGVAGLTVTSTGDRKLLDLRDFSGEGRVALERFPFTGDTVTTGATTIRGLRRVAALNAQGPFYLGTIAERPLGKLPSSDLNGDGDDRDRMPIVVTKASDGWVLFADSDGDGSLADERPVHDFLVAKETFGWTVAGRPIPLTVAANFGGTDAAPTLDLFFDTSGHGTHVSGIAAGADLYGIKGFDGVAPGAQLLGLKIANNANGGISVTGSMLLAIGYAIRFAKERAMPLVLNMSFGVGNEREGAARIDNLIDSVLAANPEVVFVTSAGNDGPGLSTMGFPGSASRVISVGATLASSFVGGTTGDVLAFFSARGGEVGKPDILAPGIAYSSVPRWNTGEEIKNGTSMASPHVAGAVSLLLSGVKQEKRSVNAGQVRQAILATGRLLPGAARIDQGSGLLDLNEADRVLRKLPAMAVLRAHIGAAPAGAGFLMKTGPARDTTMTLEIEGSLGGPVKLQSSVGWITVPATIQLTPPRTTVPVGVAASAVANPGFVAGTIAGWATDSTIGPLFRVPITIVNAVQVGDSGITIRQTLKPNGVSRLFFTADSARPFRVSIATTTKAQAQAYLHEPGGQPIRGENGIPAGMGNQAAEFDIDGRDVRPGIYEAIASALPAEPASAEIQVHRSPLLLEASRLLGDTVAIDLTNASATLVAGQIMFGLIGAERTARFSQRGGALRRLTFRVPGWARRLVVDLAIPKEQWPWFTDMGLTVFDSQGSIVVAEPMNYSLGRATAELPTVPSEREFTVVITPGFADPNPSSLWGGDLSIRLYAEAPVLSPMPGSGEFSVAPGRQAGAKLLLGALPWSLPDGFFPIGNLVVDVAGQLWGREVKLAPAPPPVMR